MKYILPRKHKCAQGTFLYVATLVAMVVAIIAISRYMQRGFQGRYRAVMDDIGPQYAPGATTVNNTNTAYIDTREYEIPSTTNNEETLTTVLTNSQVTDDRDERVTGY